jgi:hypothetical protein
MPSALGSLSPPLGLGHGQRRLLGSLPFQNIGRQLDVSLNDPHQHFVIFRATAIRFKSLPQRQGFFRAQIDFSDIPEQFEGSKHDGLPTTAGEIKYRALGSEV